MNESKHRCRICNEVKPRSAFWDGDCVGGVQWACKPCHKEYSYEWTTRHRFWAGVNYDVVSVVTNEQELRNALKAGVVFAAPGDR